MNFGDYIFKAQKGWEGEEPFWVWHLSSVRTPDDFVRQKVFLIADARPASFGVRITHEKPGSLRGNGALQGLMRKFAKAPAIGTIVQVDYHIWIPLFTVSHEPPTHWLVVAKKRPTELALVASDGTCLVRYGTGGTYTKRVSYDLPIPTEGGTLLSAGLATDACRRDDEEEGDEPDEEENPNDLLPTYQRTARDKLARRVKTMKKTIAKQEISIPDGADIEDAKRKAKFLQQFLYRVKEGEYELRLTPEESGADQEVVIALDPDASPGSNLEQSFVAIKKQERARKHGVERLAEMKSQHTTMAEDLTRLRGDALREDQVESILMRYQIRQTARAKGSSAAPVAQPFRRYQLTPDTQALVGKSARDNDAMTKAARSNDLWLHIVGPPGSHVILQGKQADDPAQIRQAAILAIHNSKLRGDMAGEVYVTHKRHLKKKKGLPAGKWIVEQAETIFFRYEQADLKKILDTLT